MGGIAGSAGGGRLTLPLSEPVWLMGSDAALPRWMDRPVVWLLDLDHAGDRRRIEALPVASGDTAAFAGRRDAGERMLRRRTARHLLRAVSGSPLTGVTIRTGPRGAPVVATPAGWSLSLAARWPRFVVAVGQQPIGVDLEVATSPLPDDLLTARERQAIAGLPDPDRPLASAAIWAAKEAHAKWTGQPRALDPATVETSDENVVWSPLGRTACWRRLVADAAIALCTAP